MKYEVTFYDGSIITHLEVEATTMIESGSSISFMNENELSFAIHTDRFIFCKKIQENLSKEILENRLWEIDEQLQKLGYEPIKLKSKDYF